MSPECVLSTLSHLLLYLLNFAAVQLAHREFLQLAHVKLVPVHHLQADSRFLEMREDSEQVPGISGQVGDVGDYNCSDSAACQFLENPLQRRPTGGVRRVP